MTLNSIIDDIRKKAKAYHHQFGIIEYIETKGLKTVIEPYFSELIKENTELKKKLDQMGKSSSDLKAKFIGEHYWTDWVSTEDGEREVRYTVPWTLQKEIFKEMCEYVKNRKDEEYRP